MLLSKRDSNLIEARPPSTQSSGSSSSGVWDDSSSDDDDNEFDDDVWVAKVTHRATQHFTPEAIASLNIPVVSARRKIISGRSSSRISFSASSTSSSSHIFSPPGRVSHSNMPPVRITSTTTPQSLPSVSPRSSTANLQRKSSVQQVQSHLESVLAGVIATNLQQSRANMSTSASSSATSSPSLSRGRSVTASSALPRSPSQTVLPGPRSLPTSPRIFDTPQAPLTPPVTSTNNTFARPQTAPTSRLQPTPSTISMLSSSSASISSPSSRNQAAVPPLHLGDPASEQLSPPPTTTKPKPPPRNKLSSSAPPASFLQRVISSPTNTGREDSPTRLRSPSAPSAIEAQAFHCFQKYPVAKIERCTSIIQRAYRMRLARQTYKKMVAVYRFCTNVAKEIVETERTYVWILRYICQRYFDPLMKDLDSVGVTADDVRTIFGGLEVIVNINASLLNALEDRMAIWSPSQCLGDLFLDMAASLKIYSDYVKNFDQALRRMDDCSKRFPKFEAFIKSAEDNGGVRVPLESHLIAPVQRIPRYALLLQQLYEKTPTSHRDSENLGRALEKIKDVASYINEKKRESDNALRVVEIQSLLIGKPPTLISAQRRFCHEGEVGLSVSGGRQKRRHCYLFNDAFLVTKPVIQKLFNNKKKYKFCFIFRLSGADLSGEGDCAFTMKTDSATLCVTVDTTEAKGVWMELLNRNIKEQRIAEKIYEERVNRVVNQKAQATCDTINQQYSALALKEEVLKRSSESPSSAAASSESSQTTEPVKPVRKSTIAQLMQLTKRDDDKKKQKDPKEQKDQKEERKQRIIKSNSSPVFSNVDEEELTKIVSGDSKEKFKLFHVLKRVINKDTKKTFTKSVSENPVSRKSVVGVVNMKTEVMQELVSKFPAEKR